MQYGATASDTWDNSASSHGGGTVDFECVGYGTLMLPNATYHNVFMVSYDLFEIFTSKSYFWYAENGALLIQYSPSFFSSAALYALQEVNNGAGIKHLQASESIHYNNPVKDILDVSIEMDNSSSLNFTLTNISGSIVMDESVLASFGTNTFNFDVSNLPVGIYFLTINSTNSNEPVVLKLIKK